MQKTQKQGRHRLLVRLTLAAVMAAASVVLCRYLGFSPGESMYRVEIGFLPIAVVAILAGPLWSAASYGVADLVGSLLTTGMNPLILLCKILTGAIFGLLLYRRKKSFFLVALTMTVVGGAVDILLMAGVFAIYGYAPSYGVALVARSINAAINLPIRVALLYLLWGFGGRFFDRFERSML